MSVCQAMERSMYKRLTIVGAVLLLSIGVSRAQSPSPDALEAARTLVTTLKPEADADAGPAGNRA